MIVGATCRRRGTSVVDQHPVDPYINDLLDPDPVNFVLTDPDPASDPDPQFLSKTKRILKKV
jgi:hypothetical protein